VFEAVILRLEQRDIENARLINELYAKMIQFVDVVSTEVTKIEKLTGSTSSKSTRKIAPQKKVSTSSSSTTIDHTSEFFNITTSLARIENHLTSLNKKK